MTSVVCNAIGLSVALVALIASGSPILPIARCTQRGIETGKADYELSDIEQAAGPRHEPLEKRTRTSGGPSAIASRSASSEKVHSPPAIAAGIHQCIK